MPAERFHLAGAEILVGCDADEAAHIAAGQFASLVREIAAQGRFVNVALSGGDSPRPVFQLLASDRFRRIVPWDRIQFFWADERNVPPNDPNSNYGMARQLLLTQVPIPPANIHRIPAGDGTAVEAAELYQRTLHDLLPSRNGLPRLDYALLGVGTNGHTASLFPHRPTLHQADRLVVADHVDETASWRVSLTAPVLNNAAQITFLATGERKAEVVYRIVEGPRDPDDAPAQLIAPASGALTWILDTPASRLLARPKPN